MKPLQILLICLTLFINASAQKLTGRYSNQYSVISERSFNDAWNKMIDLFAQYGFAIETIDKASGIIVSSRYVFEGKDKWTHERKRIPENSKAWFVVPRIKMLWPTTISGKLSVIIKTVEGKTSVSINIIDLTAITNKNQHEKWATIEVQSTGVFEKYLVDKIK